MRHQDGLYFAPGIRFGEIDATARDFPAKWVARIEGFYLQPARAAAESGEGFAAGILAVSTLDSIAHVIVGQAVGERFRCFAREYLPSFRAADAAHALYKEFRNGLLHEGRIKQAAEFSFDLSATLDRPEGVWRINPRLLVDEIASALHRLIENEGAAARIAAVVAADLRAELTNVCTGASRTNYCERHCFAV